MKPIEELLQNLARPEVLEFGLVTNRLPSVNVGGKFEPVDDEAPTTGRLLEILTGLGGGRHVETLGDKPVQWTTRVDGLGVIAVAAIMRKDVVQARFTIVRRDARAGAPTLGSTQLSAGQAAAVAAARKEAPAVPGQAQRPPSAHMRTQPGTGPSPAQGKPQGPQIRPSVQPSGNRASVPPQPAAKPAPAASSVKITSQAPPPPATQAVPPPATQAGPPPMPASNPLADAVPPPDDWDDDDDEPTVQTLSPPLSQRPAREEEPRPKPARRADEVPSVIVAPDVPAPEPSRPEPIAAPPPPHEKPPAEKVEAKPEASPKPPEAGPGPRRIDTPTNTLEAADVEITKNLHDSQKLALELDDDDDEDGNTVEIAPSAAKLPIAAPAAPPAAPRAPSAPPRAPSAPPPLPSALAAAAAVEAVPSTSPSAAVAEKDRPRGEASLDAYLAMAASANATDLHLVAGRPLLLRVASDLLPRTQVVAPEHVERIVREIVPPRLRAELEGDGACDFALEHAQHGRFRVNVSRQRTGFKISMRVLPREIPTIASLGLPEALATAALPPSGLVLVTGPSGHGKSTTIAALVDRLADQAKHIVTIEDPIEIVHPRKRGIVTQREVGTHAESAAEALRAALREDPDVLVVTDIEGAETVARVLDACDAGCLVLASINATGAARAIDRLVDVFDPSQQAAYRARLAGSIRLVIGQRLVPSADRNRLHVAVEILPWSVALYTSIRDGRSHQIAQLLQRGKPLGITRLDESLGDLVRAQKVTLEVAKQFADVPQDLDQLSLRQSSPALPVARKA